MRATAAIVVAGLAGAALATPPSVTMQEIGQLNVPVSSVADARKVVREHQAKIVALFSKVRVRQAVGGETPGLSGQVEETDVAIGDADLLLDHMTVDVPGGKVVVPANGKVYAVSIPVVVAGSTCLLKDGRVLLKLVPQFTSAVGTKTDKKTFVQTRWDIQFSEVEALSLTFYLGEDGRLYR